MNAPDTGHAHRHAADAACCVAHPHHHDKPFRDVPASALVVGTAIKVQRGRRVILDDVDIDISPGEILTLIGPNGAGKTTLVRTLLGLEAPDQGSIRRRDGLVVGYVPQRFDRDPAIPMTVTRFLTLGNPSASSEAIARVLVEVGAAGVATRQLSALSGGELQRVVLARALARNPGLLVLDEPLRGVDHVGEAELYGLIGRIRDGRGVGVLLVSHDLHVVMAQSDRVLCLNRHVCCQGVPHAVAQHPEYVRLFGAAAARAFAIYEHHHDHAHDLTGAPLPPSDDKHDHGPGVT